MEIEIAREKAAQLWCEKLNANKSMDPQLCESIANLLVKETTSQGEKSLRQIQREIAEWSNRNFKDNTSKHSGQKMYSTNALLGIVEEVGELSHCVLKRHQGIRGFDSTDYYIAHRDDAVADLLVYLCDFADREGIDLQSCLNQVWAKVQKRDWEKNPQNADKVAEGK